MASSSRFISMNESSSSASSSSLSNESSFDEEHEMISHRYNKRVQMMMNLLPAAQMLAVHSQSKMRRYIHRNREGSHQQIWKDYFNENSTYPANYFHRRYRMRRDLFIRILKDVETCEEYFVQKKDACGRLGCSSIQNMTAAIRILAYGFAADHCDEYLEDWREHCNQELNMLFCNTVVSLYEEQYMRSPNEEDIARLLQEGDERGFPGMLGFLDCMHWEWKNCPTAWNGTHRGHHHKPTLILEAVASKDLWIWHAFFGMAGTHNDLTVLDHSPIFDNLIYGNMPPVNYEVNGRRYTMGYHLTDGIYPQWATLMQTIAHPTTVIEKLFAQKQEAVRKDVERAFGVLQIMWGITQGPVKFWKKDDLCIIMKTCIILHNMIIEDECGTNVETWRPPSDETISPPEYTRNPTILAAHISSSLARIRDRDTNRTLRSDLMEHLLKMFGDRTI